MAVMGAVGMVGGLSILGVFAPDDGGIEMGVMG